jgi:hypothetical protein
MITENGKTFYKERKHITNNLTQESCELAYFITGRSFENLHNSSWVKKSNHNTSKREVFIKLFTLDPVIIDQDIMEEYLTN